MNLLPLVVMMSSLAIESTEMNPQGIKVVLRNDSHKSVKAFRIKKDENSTTSMELFGEIKSGETYDLRFYDFDIVPEVVGVIYSDGTYEGPEASVLLARREGLKAAEKQFNDRVQRFMKYGKKEKLIELDIPSKWRKKAEQDAWYEGYKRGVR